MEYIYNLIIPPPPPNCSTIICLNKENIYLVYTSYLFLIPAIYSFYKSLKIYTIILIFSTIISINYWINPTYGWRRNIDHIYSKIVFIIFFVNSYFYIQGYILNIIIYTCLFICITCFYFSNTVYNHEQLNTKFGLYWYHYHMLFHVFVTVNLMVIIYCMN